MKISGTSGISTPGVGPGARRAADSGFALPAAEAAGAGAGASRTARVSSLGSLDALLALQQVDEAPERRRRAVRRGGRLLDVLEKLKLALLDGEIGEGELKTLADAVHEQRAATDDPGLEALLDQIETRAAVELAKRGA